VWQEIDEKIETRKKDHKISKFIVLESIFGGVIAGTSEEP
jgi:hypothetical protein